MPDDPHPHQAPRLGQPQTDHADLSGTAIGRGCVLGSHAVVRGEVPDFSIAVGAPAKVVKNRQLAWETSAAQRAELAAALADIERKKAAR